MISFRASNTSRSSRRSWTACTITVPNATTSATGCCTTTSTSPVLFLWLDPLILNTVVEHVELKHRMVSYDYKQLLPAPGPETGLLRLLATLELALTTGVVEEFYYRGMMRRLFGCGCLGAVLFVVVSSVLFAGCHFEWGEQKLVYTLAWGVVMGSVYAVTGNLWPVIVGHTLVDLNWLV